MTVNIAYYLNNHFRPGRASFGFIVLICGYFLLSQPVGFGLAVAASSTNRRATSNKIDEIDSSVGTVSVDDDDSTSPWSNDADGDVQDSTTMARMKQLLLGAGDRVVDFERGRLMEADGDAAQRPQQDALRRFAQANCSSCLMREEAKLARIERIKADLLQKLGFKEPPNATARDLPPIVPHLHGLMNKWGFEKNFLSDEPAVLDRAPLAQFEESVAQTERVYAFAVEPPIFLGLPENLPVAYFKFSEETLSNNVEDAKLHFYIRKPLSPVNERVSELEARLYRIDHANGTRTLIERKNFKKDLRLNGNWEQIKMVKIVKNWFKKPEHNFGLTVEVMYSDENLVVMPKSPDADKHMMYLEVMTRDSASTRRKREAPKLDCVEQDNEPRCCRYRLDIDFESFGWDWVIAPKKYVAYYCSGECPFRHLQRYLHTHLVQQAHPRANVGPCCYPTSMLPIPMVYFNGNKEVLVSKVPGMVVAKCGCA